jgi:hypothetical protein
MDFGVAAGVLLNPFTVLTTADVAEHNPWKVVAGKHAFNRTENTQQTRWTCSSVPDASHSQAKNNYGLIHLSDPFVFDNFVNGIRLAAGKSVAKGECRIFGWGRTMPGTAPDYATELREQIVKFQNNSECEEVHSSVACIENGACRFDWGAPIVCSHDAKTYLYALAGRMGSDCQNPAVSSIPALVRLWLTKELERAEEICGSSVA